MLYSNWLGWVLDKHPGTIPVAIMVGIALLFIRSVVRALQRWEIIPDPLFPERIRRIINKAEIKALEMSTEDKTYSALAGSVRPGGRSGGSSGGDSSGTV